jgi:hypothetical protein
MISWLDVRTVGRVAGWLEDMTRLRDDDWMAGWSLDKRIARWWRDDWTADG